MKTVKLLFLEDVIPTARAGDIKEVKNGFARNYLIPKQLAVIASEHEINRAKKLRDEAQKRRALEIEEWKNLLVDIENTTLELEVRCGPTGRLYGSVTSSMIAEKLEKSIERYVDKKSIKIKSPIRTIGNYKINAHFFEDISAEITVSVIPDELSVDLKLSTWTPPDLFRYIQESGKVTDQEMYKVFNMGVGMIAVVSENNASLLLERLEDSWVIGNVNKNKNNKKVNYLD